MQIPSQNKDVKGQTWLGGPTHQVQRQHIPGYCGHVPGLKAENVFGQPFAKSSSDCLKNNVDRGFIISDKERFQSTAGNSFKSYYPEDEKSILKKNAFNVLQQTSKMTQQQGEG